jgi:hypothetical protein
MDATQILREFATTEGMPVAAIKAARADRAALAPKFVRAVEQVVDGDVAPETCDALFYVFHLLGEWRERSAYRPLIALLRLPEDDVDDILGDAVTITSHRVIAAIFDGDPAPLHEIIRDPDAHESIRARMLEALAMVTLRGEVPREQTAQFLRECFVELRPQGENMVWDGWQSAIAMLGLAELAPRVKKAFDKGFISPSLLGFADFEDDLRRAARGGPPPSCQEEHEFALFGDTIEELSDWAYSDDDEDAWETSEHADERVLWSPREGPAVNPYKGVGRNDPCPCGSGKKFKKCCLGKVHALSAPDPEPRLGSDAGFEDWFSSEPDRGAAEATYDPLVAPDPEEWRALDEEERIDMVMDFHRRARIKLPEAQVHAILHSVVENQVAEGDALPVRRTLERLMGEGLDRHDAVHAIGAVLIGHMHHLIKAGHVEGDPNLSYYAELERLTADTWRKSG